MRTTQRDQDGLTTFSASVADAASGSGLATGGIPYTFTRTGTGTYLFNFDARLIATVGVASTAGTSFIAMVNAVGAGALTITTWSGAGTNANAPFRFTVTAIDKRM